jgi:hypothetical protein
LDGTSGIVGPGSSNSDPYDSTSGNGMGSDPTGLGPGEVQYAPATISVAALEALVAYKLTEGTEMTLGDAFWNKEDPRTLTVSNMGDVIAKIKDRASCGRKIEVLEFTGHSILNGAGIFLKLHGGNNDITNPNAMNQIDKDNAVQVVKMLKSSGALAADAIIVLSACDVGNWAKFNTNKRRAFPQILADGTGLTVYAAGGAMSGTIQGGDASVDSNENYVHESPWNYGDRDDVYYVFTPH